MRVSSWVCDVVLIFFFNDTAATEIYPLSLHDALPIYARGRRTVVIIDEAQNLSMEVLEELRLVDDEDRKSTRLNSSHITISYAVFCLKKKKEKKLDNATKLPEAINIDIVLP